MEKIKVLFLLTCLINAACFSNSFSQTTDEELGYYYYNNGEFDKAKLYLEKVYKENSNNHNYTHYVNTLLELNECKEAASVAKSQTKKYPRSTMYKVNVGVIYSKCDQVDKANKHFQSLIDQLDKESLYAEFTSLGSEFARLNELEFALKAYKKGKDLIANNSGFSIYIADILGRQGKHEEMVDEYLVILEKNESRLTNIQTMLTRTIDFEEENSKRDMVRVKLLKKIQTSPTKTVFNRMLIWYFQQTGNFESAYTQVKALDKRRNAKGEEVYKFSNLCVGNKQYDLAIEGYDYILNKFDETNYYYIASKKKILSVLNTKVTENLDFTKNDLVNLEKRYVETIRQVKNYREKSTLLLELANLEVYFLHKLDTAKLIYNEVLKYPNLDRVILGKTKIAKADLLLIQNEVWDASLLYMQVEKMFKEDVLGHQAKFKNAKLYYYTGDYEWCQNQLNSLKASTSKLISNDAIDLSLLITDNYNMDTTLIHMYRFSQADLLLLQNKYEEALKKLDSINMEAPGHSLNDEILFKRYEIAYARRSYEEAKNYLEEIVRSFNEDILADNALFYLGELYEKHLNNPAKAKEMYESLLFNYPGSLFVVEARKRYRSYASKSGTIKIEE